MNALQSLEIPTLPPAGPAASRGLALLAGLGRPAEADDPQQARDTSGKLLSEMFFKPLLAEARRASRISGVGGGGRGEEVFGERLDERLADLVAAADRSGLRRAIERELGGPSRQVSGGAIGGDAGREQSE